MSLYRNNIFQGGWFSFNATKENWAKISHEMYEYFFGSSIVDEVFGESKITEELFLKANFDLSFVKGKSVLVIGGGPSSENLNDKIIDSYDFVFSCNHFFKNDFLKKRRVDFALIGDEINFNDKDFVEYIAKYNTILGFEHSSKRSTINLVNLKENYPKSFIYLTRYFSRLGYAPRACVLSRLFGANKVDFIGIDGFKDKRDSHFFEKNKSLPPFNDDKEFIDQMKIFCKYMLSDLKIKPENFNDLSEGTLYSGILDKAKEEL